MVPPGRRGLEIAPITLASLANVPGYKAGLQLRGRGLRRVYRNIVEILVFLLAPGFEFTPATPCWRVQIRPAVLLALLDEPFVDQNVKIRVEPPGVYLGTIVGFETLLDREAVFDSITPWGLSYAITPTSASVSRWD